VTSPVAALETVEVHRQAFAARGLERAFDRAIGVVVQPGVEFGNEDVIVYRPEKARALSAALTSMPQFVFEAHSTDYQPPEALAALVQDGFAILKVGPGLTFALREALYALDHIAAVLEGRLGAAELQEAMERLMVDKPGHWQKYYHGDPDELRLQRHFSYSDRIRYYWPDPAAAAAVRRLEHRLAGRTIPETLISQHLAALYPAVAAGHISAGPSALLIASVQRVLSVYRDAGLLGR
jgi:D-tagatose 6-phosphate 4-epimerase